ncbi:unnamed protein product, partial [marine sediment metagenome]
MRTEVSQNCLITSCTRITRDDRGQGLVEYGLILLLVSVAIVATLGLLTGQLQALFTQ